MNNSDLEKLQVRIGYKFKNEALLRVALTHQSLEIREIESNRRLELLGDKILGALICEKLFEKYPNLNEGILTKILTRIVCNASLAAHAKTMELGQNIRTIGVNRELKSLDTSLADAFEALIGAIQRDGDFEAARRFIMREFESDLNDTSIIGTNPKGDLQEYLQANSRPIPTYVLISSSGPDNDRTFVCAAMCGADELGRGSGHSRKEAESNAAKVALGHLIPTAS